MATAPSVALLQSAFDRAGGHPDVDVVVQGVDRSAGTICARLELRYHTARPMCCAEPACYIRALRPEGLHRVREYIRAEEAEEFLDEPPELHVVATLAIEPGFTFRQPALGATDGSQLVYDHPEP